MSSSVIPLYQGNDWNRLSDNIILDDIITLYCKAFKIDPEQLSASQELSERLSGMAHRTERTAQSIYEEGNDIAEKYDLPYGIALPSLGTEQMHVPVLAYGTTFSHVDIPGRTELAQRLIERGRTVRNSWERLGDRSISVVNTTDGPMAYWEYHAGNRVRKFLDGVSARMDSQMSTEAEEKALELLKSKITPSQYRCYVLCNCFPERSKRSDIFYFFRKGLPVLALSWHGYPEGRILACLCLHPYGYYRGTHAGVMTPTDEVIGQLLLMRANEKKFWAKSGQWSASDPRSGI